MSFDWSSLSDFSALVDVRSPAEFAVDHIPGAINMPVLDNEQRAAVGTLYKRDSFAGRRQGMAYVATNLAKMVDAHLESKGPDWRPLVYCWRGGMRSGSVVEVMRKVGWDAQALPGGYKAYRGHVRLCLESLPGEFSWQVLCGPTGAGKTLLLDELSSQGAQVLDLERLANHRGSLFGSCGTQPSQRYFESNLVAQLTSFKRDMPVFIEAESRSIGRLIVPQELLRCMHAGAVIIVSASLASRARLTARDYADSVTDDGFEAIVTKLARYVGKDQVEQWLGLRRAGDMESLAASLLEQHYDHKYARSLGKHYDMETAKWAVDLVPTDAVSLRAAAQSILTANALVC